jgi:hypothetical protein
MSSVKRGNKKGIRDVTGTGSFTDTDDQADFTHVQNHHNPKNDAYIEQDDDFGEFTHPPDWADNPIVQAVIIIVSLAILIFAVYIGWFGLAIFCGGVIATSKFFWPKSRT